MIEVFSYLVAFCFISYSLDFKIDNYNTIIFLFFIRIFWYISYEYQYVSDLLLYLILFCFLDILVCTFIMCGSLLYINIRISSGIAIILVLYQLLFLFNTDLYNKYILIASSLNMEIVLGLFNLKTKTRTSILMLILALPHIISF